MKTSITLAIEGMHCAACSARIERVLSQKTFVDAATVNLATHTAKVVFVDDAATAGGLEGGEKDSLTAEVISAINTLGFSAKEMGAPSPVLDLAIEGMHCAACSARIEKVLSQKTGIGCVNRGSIYNKTPVNVKIALSQ